MTPAQCRAARAYLDLGQAELAKKAGVGLSSVVDFERRRREVSEAIVAAMQVAFEDEGVTFIANGIEVKVKKSRPKK